MIQQTILKVPIVLFVYFNTLQPLNTGHSAILYNRFQGPNSTQTTPNDPTLVDTH